MKNKKFLYIIIIFIIALLLLSDVVVIAKYYNEVSGTEKIKIAELILNCKSEYPELVLSDNQIITQYLHVKNFNDMKTSDVSQKYYLQFYSDEINIEKLDIRLTKDGEDQTINNGKTGTYTLNCNTEQTDTFTIEVSCNENENLDGTLRVKAICEQIM